MLITKVAQIIGQFFVCFEKGNFLSKAAQDNFSCNFAKISAIFNPTSGHTGLRILVTF